MIKRLSLPNTRTLRWQVMAWHALWLCMVLVAFGGTLFWLHRRAKWQEIDSELASAVDVLRRRLPELANASSQTPVWELPATFRPRRIGNPRELPYFAVWNESERLAARSQTFLMEATRFPDADARYETRRDSTIYYLSDASERQAIASFDAQLQPVTLGEQAHWTILVGRDIQPDKDDIRSFLLTISLTGLCVLAIGLLGDWWLAKRLVRPIEQISDTAAEISATNLSRRIDTSGMTLELASLATTLNETFARIESAFEQQKQFTADASHELRTPLATIQLHQQLALSKDRTPEQYREALAVCQRAAMQMNRLVQSLLQLAQLDAVEQTSRQSVRLDLVVQQALTGLSRIAESKGVVLRSELIEAVIDGDTGELEQLIVNLVMNAIDHSPSGSVVEVKLSRSEQSVLLEVLDQGCGIAAEHLPHLFERFYRVDQARDRASGGCGLGLSICKQIAERHHGEIAVTSELGAGSTFLVTFRINEKSTATKS